MKNLQSFGKALSELRVSKGIELKYISGVTLIKKEIFLEFEKGNFTIHNTSNVYIRLFLREYIKCIDINQTEVIMDRFSNLCSDRPMSIQDNSSSANLTFLPDNEPEKESKSSSENFSILEGLNYTPKKIATIFFVFILVALFFRIVVYYA
jgi:cytoskeletal protein RodZ|tara:strand:+ start:349 stop:801 length:453 start_codon:yes stop_codon:yes gene_type:complete